MPPWSGAGVAAAVALPAADAVAAAPRRSLDDLDFVPCRVRGEERRVVGDAGELPLVDVVDGVGEGHVAVAVVVAVRLAVRGDVDELRTLAAVGEGAEETV